MGNFVCKDLTDCTFEQYVYIGAAFTGAYKLRHQLIVHLAYTTITCSLSKKGRPQPEDVLHKPSCTTLLFLVKHRGLAYGAHDAARHSDVSRNGIDQWRQFDGCCQDRPARSGQRNTKGTQ